MCCLTDLSLTFFNNRLVCHSLASRFFLSFSQLIIAKKQFSHFWLNASRFCQWTQSIYRSSRKYHCISRSKYKTHQINFFSWLQLTGTRTTYPAINPKWFRIKPNNGGRPSRVSGRNAWKILFCVFMLFFFFKFGINKYSSHKRHADQGSNSQGDSKKARENIATTFKSDEHTTKCFTAMNEMRMWVYYSIFIDWR